MAGAQQPSTPQLSPSATTVIGSGGQVTLMHSIQKAVDNAAFNGVNMVKSGGTTVYALANDSGSSKLTVAAVARTTRG